MKPTVKRPPRPTDDAVAQRLKRRVISKVRPGSQRDAKLAAEVAELVGRVRGTKGLGMFSTFNGRKWRAAALEGRHIGWHAYPSKALTLACYICATDQNHKHFVELRQVRPDLFDFLAEDPEPPAAGKDPAARRRIKLVRRTERGRTSGDIMTSEENDNDKDKEGEEDEGEEGGEEDGGEEDKGEEDGGEEDEGQEDGGEEDKGEEDEGQEDGEEDEGGEDAASQAGAGACPASPTLTQRSKEINPGHSTTPDAIRTTTVDPAEELGLNYASNAATVEADLAGVIRMGSSPLSSIQSSPLAPTRAVSCSLENVLIPLTSNTPTPGTMTTDGGKPMSILDRLYVVETMMDGHFVTRTEWTKMSKSIGLLSSEVDRLRVQVKELKDQMDRKRPHDMDGQIDEGGRPKKRASLPYGKTCKIS